jgi:Thioredoxin
MNRQQNGTLVVQHPAVADGPVLEGRLHTKRFNRRDFLLGFLAVFSLCSLLLNGVFVFHLSHPSFWRDFKLSWLHPPPVRASDHVRGDSNAPVTVIEYADFQCPYCQQMHAALQTAVQEGRIRWVYRHFPLSSIHPLAFKEAEAAECAGAQGKFWEYADALFATQARLGFIARPRPGARLFGRRHKRRFRRVQRMFGLGTVRSNCQNPDSRSGGAADLGNSYDFHRQQTARRVGVV